jgi:hypothetical protein
VLGTPREVRWLSEKEKDAAIARVIANQTGSDRDKRSDFKWDQVWATFRGKTSFFCDHALALIHNVVYRSAVLLFLLRYYHKCASERRQHNILEADLEVLWIHSSRDPFERIYAILLREHLLVFSGWFHHTAEAQPPMYVLHRLFHIE